MSDPPEFLKGNEALAYGALRAGLTAFYGYPITPSSEIPETLAAAFGRPSYPRFRVFLQAASELEAINLAIGSAATGARTMTATSGPGFSLKQEGISYAAAMELPLLIVNVNRAGPGLGNLGPEQSDYFQATRGGGHGGYRTIVLAPDSVAEMARMPSLAFALAFRYRTPVIVLADAFLGQLKEDLELPEVAAEAVETPWAVTGALGRERHVLASIHLELADQNRHSRHLQEKFATIGRLEQRAEDVATDDADVVIVAYGICARIARAAVVALRDRGCKVGLLRPISLAPFPRDRIDDLVLSGVRRFLVLELNHGQMVDDVQLAVAGRAEVRSVTEVGGLLPSMAALGAAVESMSDRPASFVDAEEVDA